MSIHCCCILNTLQNDQREHAKETTSQELSLEPWVSMLIVYYTDLCSLNLRNYFLELYVFADKTADRPNLEIFQNVF